VVVVVVFREAAKSSSALRTRSISARAWDVRLAREVERRAREARNVRRAEERIFERGIGGARLLMCVKLRLCRWD